jgi:HemY protein
MICLCALALAIGLVLTHPWGGAVFVVGDYRLEFKSLGVLLLIWMMSILIGHWLLSMSKFITRFFLGLKGLRRKRKVQQARMALRRAGLALFEGRYREAETDAKKAIRDEDILENRALAYLVAARAAGLQNAEDAEVYLDALAAMPKNLQTGRHLLAAELALEARDAPKALQALQVLPKQSLVAQKIALYAHLILRNDSEILRLSEVLLKARMIPAEACYKYRQDAHQRLLLNCQSMSELNKIWTSIDHLEYSTLLWQTRFQKTIEMHQPDSVVDFLVEGGDSLLEDPGFHMSLLIKPLVPVWSSSDRFNLLKKGESWLEKFPQHSDLLLSMGYLAEAQGLWGKAENYFEASAAVAPSREAYVALGDLKREKSEDEAQLYYQKAAKCSC